MESYLFYAYGEINDIITENPIFTTLGSQIAERQQMYRRYVLE